MERPLVVTERVDRRTLNRTLLARQLLYPVAPVGTSVSEVAARLVGLQAQDPKAPYVGMWSRIAGFEHAALADALVDRSLVRMATLRGTVHLHAAADTRIVRTWTQSVLERALRTTRAAAWSQIDRGELVATVEQLLQEAPMAASTLGEALTARWPTVSSADLHQFARAFLPLVQAPPRGVWGKSGTTTYTTAASWLDATVVADALRASDLQVGVAAAPPALVRRYLAAYGPASVRDVQAWSGLTRLTEVVDAMPDLRRYVDDDGAVLYDVDAPLADAATDLPPLYIAPFDNVTLSHADRRRIIDEPARRIVATKNGMIPGMVLIDGVVAGTWRVEGVTLQVTPMRTWSQRTQAAVRSPGRRLLHFLTGRRGEVQILPAS